MNGNIVLLNDTYSWYHWGCTGTSLAIRERIRAAGFSLTCVPVACSYTLKGGPASPADFDSSETFRRCTSSNQQLMDILKKASIVIANGEGTLHGNRPPAISLLYLLYISKKFLGKNVQIINHSCYPQDTMELTNTSLCSLYKLVYECMDFIAIREHRSQEVIKRLGINSCLTFDCLPLNIDKHHLTRPSNETPTILVAGSADIESGFIKYITRFMKLATRAGYEVKVLTGARAYPAPDDRNFIRILENTPNLAWQHVIAESLDEWLNTIAGVQVLVSGRFHHSIAAAATGVPCVLINSTTPKMEALAEMLNTDAPIRRDDVNLPYILMERAENAMNTPGKAGILSPDIIQRAEKNFDGLLNLAPSLT